jgi:hypothetical protein
MLGWTSLELGFLLPTVYAEGPNSNKTAMPNAYSEKGDAARYYE